VGTRTKPLTTSEQRALEACRSEWLEVGASTEPADRPAAETAVKQLYAVIGLKEPMTIWMDSPLGGAAASAWFESVAKTDSNLKGQIRGQIWGQIWGQIRGQIGGQIWGQIWGQIRGQIWGQIRGQIGDQIWDQIGGQIRDQIGDQIWGQIGGQIRDQIGDQIWDQIGDQIWGQIWGQIGDQIWDQIGDQIWDQIGDQIWGQIWGQIGDQIRWAWYGQHDAHFIAWMLFARELGAKYGKQLDEGLDAWAQITRSCGWWWPREGVAVLTERHRTLRRDEEGRLHCDDGPAVAYPDGYALWAIHGVRVPPEVVEDPDVLNVERISQEQNVEVRRVMVDRYGPERYLQEANATCVDQVHEPRVAGLSDAKLWKLDQEGDEPLAMVECVNSSPEPDGSYKRYYLRVPPRYRTVLGAIAWTFQETRESYRPKVET
jgi:hypothetical protein